MLAALRVADAVERRDHLAHEATVLLEHGLDGLGIEVGVHVETADLFEVDQVVEHEGDVGEGRSVVSHGQTVDRPGGYGTSARERLMPPVRCHLGGHQAAGGQSRHHVEGDDR
jgi:hypothetical protein